MKLVWTEDKINYLQNNYSNLPAEELAANLNTTVNSVYQKAYKLGLKGRENGSWNKDKIKCLNEQEINFIKENYTNYGAKYCANKLNKVTSSIQKIANKLGLKVNISISTRNNLEFMEKLRNNTSKILQKYNEQNKKIKTEEDKQTVLELYQQGKSVKQIAEIFKCSTGPISKILKNTPKRKPGEYENHFSKKQGFGETHHTWKGGYKSIYERVRDLNRYWEWRDAVLNRDNNCCINCKSTDKLHAHHIVTLKNLIDTYCITNNKLVKDLNKEDLTNDYFYDINNGSTLCEPCHKDYHKKFGR